MEKLLTAEETVVRRRALACEHSGAEWYCAPAEGPLLAPNIADAEIIARVNEAGGCVGFVGVIHGKHRYQVFVSNPPSLFLEESAAQLLKSFYTEAQIGTPRPNDRIRA
jgi:hypothetical protein